MRTVIFEDTWAKFYRIRFSRPAPAPVDLNEDAHHRTVRHFWIQRQGSERRSGAFIARNPRLALRAAAAICRLPTIEARLSDSANGRKVGWYLTRICFSRVFRMNAIGICVLAIPKPPARYGQGSDKQTLRRKVRSALRAGVTWRSVDDPDEQRRLVARLDGALATKIRYREVGADHSYLVASGPWTVAFAPDGAPLLVAVTPYDGEWALLQAFLTLGDSPLHSDTRYLLTQVVIERLSDLGVRYLFDSHRPHELPVGLWHFQQMVGFRMARVRVRRRPPPAARATVP